MKLSKVLVLSAFLGSAMAAHADVLVNTFGAGGVGYFPSVGWNINDTQFLGKTFSIGSDYNFTGIDIAFRMSGDTDQFLVSLRSDTGGTVGSTLEAFTVTNAFGSNVTGVYNLSSVTNALMTAGTYYVTIEALNGASGKWNLNNGAGTGAMVVSTDGGSTWGGFTDTNGVVRVMGTQAVPEPASFAALGFGALVLLRRRRK